MSTTAEPTPTTAASAVETAVAAGGDVMRAAAEALHVAAARFEALRPAFDVLLAAQGRVIVTGLGKSGLVGAKLAATLASTGTPAQFVHASDALHGDAGALGNHDVLLALSKSGTTDEVVRFAELAVERGVSVVSLTGCDGSSPLCRLAVARLDGAVTCEADPWDLVPTSSTTVAIALGDALAVGLMVARGFGPAQFHRHHPAGALGARLARSAR